MEENRPDPDKLLEQVRAEETRAARGRLRVYLGMCPGVGKTFAMLEGAQERHRAGESPLVGIAETHGRRETEELLEGLDILPRRQFEHRGITIREFDLDAALARRPSLLILDELPHTNAPGSRHSKRWQDVEELVEAGVNVFTAINVQHVESLNDAVAQITTVRVRETVPDSFLEGADEVVLVDLTPEELLQRLREGKVYLGEQMARAEDRFFKAEKLTALRELALRYVAERVSEKVLEARGFAGATGIWPTRDRLLVGVGPAPSSARLVRATKRLASVLQCPWHAVSVETVSTERSPAEVRSRIAEHLRLAEQLGAQVGTIQGSSVAEALLAEARSRNVTKIVVGKPVLPRWRELIQRSPVDELVRRSGDIDVYVIRGDEGATPPILPAASPEGGTLRPYAIAIAAAVSASILATVMDQMNNWFGLTDIAMVYVVAVAMASLRGSRRAAALASLLSVLAFNFLFVPPRHTFAIESPQYLATFSIMFAVSLFVSTLSIRHREQRDSARRGARKAEDLRRFTELLAVAADESEVAAALAEQVRRTMGAEAHVYLPAADDKLIASPPTNDEKEDGVARWVFDHQQSAGRGTQTLASSSCLHMPVANGDVTHAVLAVRLPESQQALYPDQRLILDALVRQAVLAMDVKRLDRERRKALVEVENERLRSSILSAVSHDLRTPLSSIIGSTSGLVESPDSYTSETRQALLSSVLDEAERLNRLFTNLLEFTRLEGGALRPRLEAISVVDIVSAALQPLRRRLACRQIDVELPPDLPFVLADELLLHHVLWNLLDNAAKFSPDSTEIAIRAERDKEFVAIEVADRGPGMKEGEIPSLFEKFRRGSTTGATRGVGLGLAICKGIITVHGGTITARNRSGGGAIFRFTLPVAAVDVPREEEA